MMVAGVMTPLTREGPSPTRLDGRTSVQSPAAAGRRTTVTALVAGLLAVVFVFDARTGEAPFQHLYYLPIVVAGMMLPRYAGPFVGLVAVVLYHYANPILLTARYREADVVQIILFVAIGVVTSKLADDRRQLRRLAATDDLTGLYNLRGFDMQLTILIRAARIAGMAVALLVFDVDRLKSINDVHGHRAGADAVRTVGRLVGATLPAGAFACRFGGDEFVVAVAVQDETRAIEVAEALRESVHATAPVLAGTPFPAGTLSISIGVACRSGLGAASFKVEETALAEQLFHDADQALYAAKAAGRNQIRCA